MPDAGVTALTVEKTAKITFVLPTKPVDELQLTFDDRAVPIDVATRTFRVTPGRHRVVADGTRAGMHVHYDGEMTAVDGALVSIPLELKLRSLACAILALALVFVSLFELLLGVFCIIFSIGMC